MATLRSDTNASWADRGQGVTGTAEDVADLAVSMLEEPLSGDYTDRPALPFFSAAA
jgi:hypothetical protein